MSFFRNVFQTMSCTSARATRDVVPMGENLAMRNQAHNTQRARNNRNINVGEIEHREAISLSTAKYTRNSEIVQELSELKEERSTIIFNLRKKATIDDKIKKLGTEMEDIRTNWRQNGFKSETLITIDGEPSREIQMMALLHLDLESLNISQDSKNKIADIIDQQKNMFMDNNKFFNKNFADIRADDTRADNKNDDDRKRNNALADAASILLDIPMMYLGQKDAEVINKTDEEGYTIIENDKVKCDLTDEGVSLIENNFEQASKMSTEIREALQTRDVNTIKNFIQNKLNDGNWPQKTQLQDALHKLSKIR